MFAGGGVQGVDLLGWVTTMVLMPSQRQFVWLFKDVYLAWYILAEFVFIKKFILSLYQC